jgi:formylglycine-generating enzyme required for sulfatase activity
MNFWKRKARTLAFVVLLAQMVQAEVPVVLPDHDSDGSYHLVWPSHDGYRYTLEHSTNLVDWKPLPTFPITATNTATEMRFSVENQLTFFRVRQLDDQAPTIVGKSPEAGSFAVNRSSIISIVLEDQTQIDPGSIQLIVGDMGVFTTNTTQLKVIGNQIVFDPAPLPIGGYGEQVPVALVVGDILGNRATYNWTFGVEVLPKAVTNLVVFGSQGSMFAKSVASSWTLSSVLSNKLIINYTGAAPVFASGTFLANRSPKIVDEIFYRKVLSSTDDPTKHEMTLFTVDVPLQDMIEDGSVALSGASTVYDTSDSGGLIAMMKPQSLEAHFQLPKIGFDASGNTLFDADGVSVTLDEGFVWLHPNVAVSIDVRRFTLQRLKIQADGLFESALVARLNLDGTIEGKKEKNFFRHTKIIYLGQAGPVPVWLDLQMELDGSIEWQIGAQAELRTGVRQELNLSFGVDYDRDRQPAVIWNRSIGSPNLTVVPFTYEVNGDASAIAKLIPKLDFRVMSLAGVNVFVDPRVEISGSASFLNGLLQTADFRFGTYADLNAGLSLLAVDPEKLPHLPPYRIFSHEWTITYPPQPEILIRRHPRSQQVAVGDWVGFEVEAASSDPLTYQWYHNGVALPQRTGPTLQVGPASVYNVGAYFVRIHARDKMVESSIASLKLTNSSPEVATGPVNSNQAFIPSGLFEMGDLLGENPGSSEYPIHTVFLNEFYIDQTEIVKSTWDDVYNWAIGHGYGFENAGQTFGPNHPVHSINWFDAVKWSNARSEREGLIPCYYTGPDQITVYRTGQTNLMNSFVRWGANGYRLPTEAEWERAARGGRRARFPWGDTISHIDANYWSDSASFYDVSATRGFHPLFQTSTSPVGFFRPNAFGLYDVIGNVAEWNWDLAAAYNSTGTLEINPHGPFSAPGDRMSRGGTWWNGAWLARCAARSGFQSPGVAANTLGFRCVRMPYNLKPPLIQADHTSYRVNQDIKIAFRGALGNPRDWIGLYREGQLPGVVASTRWFYLNGTTTAGQTVTDGELIFTGGLPTSGFWRAYLFSDDGYEVLVSIPIRITSSGGIGEI